ncbi:MAG: LysM peptidoglycan-binding domain-containing protein [Bacteroidota bacterium]
MISTNHFFRYFIYLGIALSWFLLSSFTNTTAKNSPGEEVEQWSLAEDDPVVAALDSLAMLTVFRNLEKRDDAAAGANQKYPPDFIPEFHDSVYIQRFEQLNKYSTIDFVYNSYVKSYINLYASRRRDLTEKIMGLSQLYFPIFEEHLDRLNLPLELKYLAVIESALNPLARSRVGATGLWQFMYGTGKMYGLQVNTMVDERSDILQSTIAACEHFVDLYDIYGDWNLVMAAYNAGPGNVNRAIRRARGVKDFWIVRNYLPRETRNYVPAFMAVTYVMEHAEEHNLFPIPPLYSHFDIDTLEISKQLSLRVISDFIDIPLDHLRFLNPTFKQNIIPENSKNPYYLRIPQSYTGVFLANADTIYNHKTPEQIEQEERAALLSQTTVHIVRSGEVLGSIARRYGTSVRQIQSLNNMRGTMIRPGQRLIVRAPARPPLQIESSEHTHLVKSGESINIIAGRYRVSANQIKQWNNLRSDIIHPGQKLIVRDPAHEKKEELAEEKEKQDIAGQNIAKLITNNESAEENAEDPPEEKKNTPYIYYIVQSGDTMFDIATRFDEITVDELTEVNQISVTSPLIPGQKILIPLEN